MNVGTDRGGRIVGRYALYDPIAAGGMATVHLGRLLGPVGFSRTVAIKRLHAQYAADPEFVAMFLDEARLAARIRHPNVVPTLDVVATDGELFLVMDYVPGESVARLIRAVREAKQSVPLRVLSAIMSSALHGLHAAHEARDERGMPLGIVHRDVSPQNVLVGSDGVARVLDFGVAKAAGRIQLTKEGQVKGKLAYMPPEQLRGAEVTRQTDIYAIGVMLWELLTGKRLFAGENEGLIVAKILEGKITPPSHVSLAGGRTMPSNQQQLAALDQMILRALDSDPARRYPTAREMALELERILPPAPPSEVGEWVEALAHEVLTSRARLIADIESSTQVSGQGRAALASLVNMPPTPPGAYVPAALPTQVSTISVTTSQTPKPARSNAGAILAAGVLLAAALVGSAWLLRGRATPPPPPVIAVAPPPPPPTVVVAPAPTPTPTVEDPPIVDAGVKPVAPRKRASDDDCTTPYWYDTDHVKHYKPQCLGK